MKTPLLALFFSLLFCALQAQDPHFSQFFANRVYLNPAYAGLDPGWTVTMNYRNQWFGIPDGDISTFNQSFRTYQVTADLQVPCMFGLDDVNGGFALSVFRDEAGGAPFVTQGAGLAFSHEQQLIRKGNKNTFLKLRRLDLRMGGQLSFMQKAIDGNYFLYSDQLDPVVGIIENPSVLQLSSRWFPNVNAGFMFRGYRYRSEQRNTLFTVGFSFSNVNQPNESIREVAEAFKLPMRFTFHAGTTHRITNYKGVRAPAYISPQFRWDSQSAFRLNLHSVGAYVFSKGYYTGLFFQYNFPNANNAGNLPLSNNFLFKNTSTLILNAGVDLKSVFDLNQTWKRRKSGIVLGFTYDVNLTGLTSNNSLGVLEFNLRMNFDNGGPRDCGEIGRFELYGGKCPVRF
jgi:type IX secretion system PorP/SprF family membrane protein